MADHQERIGQMVGDYRLQHWLGGGGFGNVYLAEQIREGQRVAVKVLQIRLTRQDDLRAFINEARTIRLRHPHIVPLLDFGLSREDAPFLVMEYAPKGTLRDRHPKGTRVPLLTVVVYATQIASALQYSHDHHLVHRDVKPENMLVRSDGIILLSDFGIATAAPGTHSLSINQGMAGTVSYMAPEQLTGKPRAASDQYALAVVVYEWLAGTLPFQGIAIEVAMQHATLPPPSLGEQAPDVPKAVEDVVFKALAKDYKERFASMQEFVSALQHASSSPTFRQPASFDSVRLPLREGALLPTLPPALFLPVGGHAPIAVSPMVQPPVTQTTKSMSETALLREIKSAIGVSPSQQLPIIASANVPVAPPARKSSLSKGWGALLIVLATLLIAGGSYAYSVVNTMQVTAMPRVAATATAKAASDAYNADVAQQGIMFGFDAEHTRTNPYEHILNVENVSQLQQAWTFSTGGVIDSTPAVANGVVYIGSQDGKLYAFDAATGQPRWIVPAGTIDSSPAIVNGVVYIGTADGIHAFDAATGQHKWRFFFTHGAIDSSPAIANGVVYAGSQDGKLYAFDAATGHMKWIIPTGGAIDSSPAVANGVVYASSQDGKLYAFDFATRYYVKLRWIIPVGTIDSSPAVANGVVYIDTADSIHAFDAATGQPRWVVPTGGAIKFSPAVANGVVYVSSQDGKLYAFDAATGQPRWIIPTSNPIDSSPAIANGVVYVSSQDGKLYAFDAATGQQKWNAPAGSVLVNVAGDSSPTVANGMVYVGSNNHEIYAFSLPKNSS